MYKNEYGARVFERLEDFFDEDLELATEDEDYYYFGVKGRGEDLDIVNKKSGKVGFVYYIEYICDREAHVTPIDMEKLKQTYQKR